MGRVSPKYVVPLSLPHVLSAVPVSVRMALGGWCRFAVGDASVDVGAVRLYVVAEEGCHAVTVKATVRLIPAL